jgi:PAS domain S-box-containing protein
LFEVPPEVTAVSDHTEATVVVDGDGVVVAFNPAAEALLGHRAADVVGDFVELLLPADKRWAHRTWRQAYMAEMTAREMDPDLEPEAETAAGDRLPVAVSLVPVETGGATYVAARIGRR